MRRLISLSITAVQNIKTKTATTTHMYFKTLILTLVIGIISISKTIAACYTISGQPSNASGCSGTNVSFSITTSGTTGSPTYQWYVSSDAGTTWVSITNAGVYSTSTTTILNITGIKASMSGLRYRCAMTTSCSGTTNSNTVTLTVTGTSFQASTSSIYAYYPFNGNAIDESGMNNTGTLQNTPSLTADRFGNANKAYSFNGSTQYVSTAKSFSNPSNFTISVWFKTTTLQGGRIVGFGDAQTGASGNYDRFIWMTNEGKLYFAVNPGGVGYTLNSTYGYNDGSWHLVTATCSSTNGSNLYVDGSLVSSNTNAKGGQNYTGYWRINYDGTWGPNPSSNYFNGSMDDIFIYHTELTASQVATLYTKPDGAGSSPVCNGGTLNLTAPTGGTYSWSGPSSFTSTSQNPTVSNMSSAKTGTYTLTYTNGGCSYTSYTLGKTSYSLGPNLSNVPTSSLQSWYKFNGDASDAQLNNHGVTQNSPTLTTDRFGNSNSAYSFDGISQYITTSVSYSNPSDFSLCVWFKTSTTSGGRIIGFGTAQTGVSGARDRMVWVDNNGYIVFGVNPSGSYTVTSSSTYNDGNWHQVIVTCSSTNGIKMYMDGVLDQTNPGGKGGENYSGYWRIAYDAIGWSDSPSNNFFSGSIDDIQIYSREITSSEVSTLYSSPTGAGTNTPLCSGNTLNLTATTISSSTYAWSGPNSFSSTSQSPSISNITSSNAGTYSLTVTASGCQNTAYALATVYTTPTVSGSTSACDGAAASLTGTGSPIQWQLSTDGGSTYTMLYNTNPYSGVTTTTLSISKVTEIMNGFKYRTYNHGCISPTSGTLTVNPAVNSLPSTNIIGYYPFNGNANDESGTGNNGTLQNTPTLTTDRFGNANSAYSFDGSTQYVSTTRSFTNINNFTLSLWFKTTTTSGGKLIGIGSSQTGTSGSYDRHIYMNNNGQIYFGTYNGTVTTLNTSYSYNDGNWHMATASMSSTNGMKLYIDGSLVASNASVTTAENATEYWKIGYDQINTGWPSYPTSNYFNGVLDDVLIYNTELSSTNVSTLYNSPLGASSNSPVCNGGTLNLSASTVSGATYSWTGPNSFSSSSQNPSVTSMSSAKTGTYTLTTTASGCSTTAYTLVALNNSLTGSPNIFNLSTTNLNAYYKLEGNARDATGSNNGVLQGSPTATTDRFGNSNSAYSLNGTSQYISTTLSYANPTNFTMSIWFKTNTSTGGDLVSFGSGPTGYSGQHDRLLYMMNSGQIIFGVWTGTNQIITSTSSYNDGNWHMATASLSSTNGMKLYVDATLVASNASVTSAENSTGYWKYGYDGLSSWPSFPSSDYFSGSIDDIIMYGRELSASEVTTLYKSADGAGSNSIVCQNTALTLSASSIAGATYSWTGPNTYTSTSQNPTVTSTMSNTQVGTYALTVTVTATGCTKTAYTLVKMNTAPSVTASGTATICSGNSTALSSTPSGGTTPYTYSWSPSGSLNSGTVQNPTASPTSTTTYSVTATDANSCSSTPATVTVSVNSIPSAPTANAGSNVACTSISANWSSATNATGYYLDVSTSNTFASFVTGYNNKDVANVTTYSVTGLTAGITYYYRVRAYNSCGTSGNSSTITYATSPATPSAPTANAGSNAACTSISANWSSAANATGYYLDVATDNAFTSMVTGFNNKDVSNVTTYSVTGLTAGTTYYYRVRAYNSCGTSGNSSTITYATSPAAPSAPTVNAGSSSSCNSITANWSLTANATGYYLDVSTSISFASFVTGYNNKDVANVTTYSVTGLTGGTTYYYRVRAYNGCGTSGNVGIVSTTTSNAPSVTAGSNSPIAYDGTINLTATGTGSSYSWTGPASYSSASQNPSITNARPSMNGSYTVTAILNGCTANSSVSVTVLGNIFRSAATGNWNNVSSWEVSADSSSWTAAIAYPDATSNSVVIVSPHVITVNTASATKNLFINSGATITNNNTLSIAGVHTTNGTYTDNGTTIFNGSSSQSINGTTNYKNLTISNSNGITVNSPVTINGILSLSSGTLTTNSNVIVNLNTGAISGTGSGNVSGNITVKKNLNVLTHHFISTPLSSTTVSELTDDIYLAPRLMYYYNESLVTSDSMSGWVGMGNFTTAPLQSMTGYDVYLYSPTNLIDITGTYVHSNSYSKTVTHTNTNGGNLNTGGWNLVGNPFPSALDWDASSGWTKTNIDNAYYIWDPSYNRYVTYSLGTGTNGGTRYIPSMQGFWVHVSNVGSGTLAIDNNARTTASTPSNWKMGFTNVKELRITASNGKLSDETVLKWRDDASNDFDSNMDAYKLYNSSSCPDLFTKVGDTEYAINNLNSDIDQIIIPLKLNAGTSGIHQLTATGFESFSLTDSIFLEDRLLNKVQDLKQNNKYSCTLSKGDTTTRFYLHFKNTQMGTVNGIIIPEKESVTIYPKGDYISVSFNNPSAINADITIYTLDGEMISEFKNMNTSSENYLPMYGNTNSLYLIKVVLKDKVFAQKVNYIRE